MTVSEPERRRAWALAAGRCVICNKYMLEGGVTHREIFLGELAHIVGQKDSEKSPRGKAANLSQYERDSADNLILVCADEHDEIDNRDVLDAATLEWLHRMKREHEARVKLATSFGPDRRSTVLRMIGNLRGQVVEIFQDTASTTVLHSGERLPEFTLAYDRHSIEIDLRKIPGEAEGGPDYYRTAMATIDEVVAGRVREGIARDAIPHLSVFAFARLPLLVYLGSRLDDTVPTSIYQRHRATEEWSWPDPTAGAATFELTVDGAEPADEGLLVLNISGTIHNDELPSELSELPTYRITTKGPDPSPDAVDTPEVLQRFEAKVRELLAHLESTNKTIRRLHVFAAVPISAAVTLGRTTDPNVHPCLVLYDRVDHSYQHVLEVRP